MRHKWKTVNPSLLVIIAEGFLSRLSFGIISFALPVYAYRHLGLSLTETGFLFSLNLIAEQALKPVMGWVADRFGLKRSFTTAVALRSLVALMLAFASASWQVYLIRIVHGISESLRDPSVNALIADNSARKAIASSFAWYSTAKTVAGSLGKAAGGILLTLTAYNYSTVFLIAFALSMMPLYVVARYVKDERRDDIPEIKAEAAASALGQLETERPPVRGGQRKSVLPFVVLGFLVAGTANLMHNLFPVMAMEYGGLSAAETGIIYTLSVLVVLFAGPLFGWLSDNVSRRLVLLVRGICNTLASIIYLIWPAFLGIAAGKVVDDLGKAAFRPAWGTLMAYVSSFDRGRRVRTLSYLSWGEGMGEIVGPILAGFLWSTWGIPVVLGARVALALASEIYAVIVTGPLERMEGYNEPGRKLFRRSESFAGTSPQSVDSAPEG